LKWFQLIVGNVRKTENARGGIYGREARRVDIGVVTSGPCRDSMVLLWRHAMGLRKREHETRSQTTNQNVDANLQVPRNLFRGAVGIAVTLPPEPAFPICLTFAPCYEFPQRLGHRFIDWCSRIGARAAALAAAPARNLEDPYFSSVRTATLECQSGPCYKSMPGSGVLSCWASSHGPVKLNSSAIVGYPCQGLVIVSNNARMGLTSARKPAVDASRF
jgi:hypothetical protein